MLHILGSESRTFSQQNVNVYDYSLGYNFHFLLSRNALLVRAVIFSLYILKVE